MRGSSWRTFPAIPGCGARSGLGAPPPWPQYRVCPSPWGQLRPSASASTLSAARTAPSLRLTRGRAPASTPSSAGRRPTTSVSSEVAARSQRIVTRGWVTAGPRPRWWLTSATASRIWRTKPTRPWGAGWWRTTRRLSRSGASQVRAAGSRWRGWRLETTFTWSARPQPTPPCRQLES